MQPASENVELEIRFDGTVTGLAQHRLSLAAFGPSLEHLLKAFRRAVDQVALSAESERAGKFGRHGQKFDLQLQSLADGCVRVAFHCVSENGADDTRAAAIAQQAVGRILENIEREAKGQQTGSRSVRRFLESLPSGLTSQSYEGRANGQVIKRVSLGPLTEIEQQKNAPPRILEIKGKVVSVSFETGKEQVRVRQFSDRVHICLASPDVVEKAVALRHQTVFVQILARYDTRRLLSIRGETEPPVNLSGEDRLNYTFQRWDGLLQRLAE